MYMNIFLMFRMGQWSVLDLGVCMYISSNMSNILYIH